MKVISIDFNSLSYKGGIATFNQQLDKIFEGNIEFITFFKGAYYLKNESNFGLNKKLFKIINAIFKYNISSLLLYMKLTVIPDKSSHVLILNSPSFIKKLPKGFAKVILVQHQDSKVTWENRSGFNRDKRFLEHCKRKIDNLVVLTNFDLTSFRDSLGFESRKIVVIPHSLSLEIKSPRTEINSKSIMMMTRLDNKQKRIDLAIRAMKSLQDWRLNVYGSGADEGYLKKIVQKENINNVTFHGLCDDKYSAFSENSIHLMTSDFEGFGISNIESISQGVPIIIRDTFGAAKEIIQNDNGILLNSAWDDAAFVDAINCIHDNYEFYSCNANSTANNYSFDTVREKWHNLCRLD